MIAAPYLRTAVAAGMLAVSACAMPTSEPNIVQVAQSAGNFDTLVAAVTAADLADTLSGPGPFTVFAPTDAAFDALPERTVDDLLLPENKAQLVSILTYHLVPGEVLAADLTGTRQSVATVNGASVHIDGRNGVTVENATVVTPDVQASNGVIHAIDEVLIP